MINLVVRFRFISLHRSDLQSSIKISYSVFVYDTIKELEIIIEYYMILV